MAKVFLVLSVFAALALNVARGEVSFGIDIQPKGRAIPEGEQAIVSVRVVSGQRIEQIPRLVFEGGELEVQRGGTRQSSFLFGRNSRHDVTYTFGVRGKPGSYSIRAEVADASGQVYESDPVALSVRARTAQEKAIDPELKVRLPKTTLYEGEPIDVSVFLVVKEGSRYSYERGNLPKIEGDGLHVIFDNEVAEGPEIDGHPTAEFKARVVPLRPGELSLIATFEPEVATPTSTRRLRARRFDLSSDLQPLQVKALPSEGRPGDFSGAVGSFQLTIGADPLALKPSEPIRVRLSLSGQGNFDTLTAPQPTSKEGWQLYDPSPLELQRGEDGAPSKLEFEQNIVPLVVKDAIPSFKLVTFDPEKEAYVNLITAPIPLQMTAGSATAPAPVTPTPAGGEPTNDSPQAAKGPEAQLTDILMANGTAVPSWANASPALWQKPQFWWYQGALVVALLVTGLAVRVTLAKRSRPDSKPTFGELLHQAERAPAKASAFYAAAQRCLDAGRHAFGAEPGDALLKLEERRAFVEFAGDQTAAGREVPAEERREILDALRSLQG